MSIEQEENRARGANIDALWNELQTEKLALSTLSPTDSRWQELASLLPQGTSIVFGLAVSPQISKTVRNAVASLLPDRDC